MAEEKEGLERFVEAQAWNYGQAVEELKAGRKLSHWMWYVFPQLKGLGRSLMAEKYGIAGLDEARAYLAHEVLGPRLRGVCEVILSLPTSDAREVFGWTDSMKLRSSMTLFDLVSSNDIFAQVIDKYFDGQRDALTLRMVGQSTANC